MIYLYILSFPNNDTLSLIPSPLLLNLSFETELSLCVLLSSTMLIMVTIVTVSADQMCPSTCVFHGIMTLISEQNDVYTNNHGR